MKAVVIIFAVFLTGTNGQLGSSAVRRILREVSENITALGFDPYSIPGNSLNFSLPGTNLLLLEAGTGGVEITGISNLELDRFRYSVSTSRATFSVTLPNITINFNQTYVRLKFFDLDFSVRLSGSISILEITLSGTIRIRVGIISDFEVREVDLDFSISKFVSNLKVELLGQDVSDNVNNFINSTIPNTLNENRSNINEFLESIVLQAAGSG